MKTGIENSTGEIIFFMDADLQDDPKDINKFLKKLMKATILLMELESTGRKVN